MTGTFPIATLAWLFGGITVAVPLAVAYRFRRRPIVALIAAGERREAFHRDTLAALDTAIAAGTSAEAARLEPARAAHVRALARLAAAREFPGRR